MSLSRSKLKKLSIVLFYGSAQLFVDAAVSIQQPFYPREAEKKGVNATEYGFVFGIFQLASFLASLFMKRIILYFGPKTIYCMGLMLTGTSSILFGLLDKVDDSTYFYILSLVLRALEGIGTAAVQISSLTTVVNEFPKDVAKTFSIVEALGMVGMSLGPIYGGGLYEIGGFPLPFLFNGSVLLTISVITLLFIPSSIEGKPNARFAERQSTFQVLRIPEVFFAGYIIFCVAITTGYLQATLEPQIRIFGYSALFVGMIVSIYAVTYGISMMVWAAICDWKQLYKNYVLISIVLAVFGFLLIGPAQFFGLRTTLPLVITGELILGIGVGGCLAVASVIPLKAMRECGYPENTETFTLNSSLWTTWFSLGNFVGPSVSGVLYDSIGFSNGTEVASLFYFPALVAVLLLYSKKQHQYSPTTSSSSEHDLLLQQSK